MSVSRSGTVESVSVSDHTSSTVKTTLIGSFTSVILRQSCALCMEPVMSYCCISLIFLDFCSLRNR